MAIARFLDGMFLALRASGLWLRYATLQNLIPSFPWIAPGWRAWGRKGSEGSNFAIWQPWIQARRKSATAAAAETKATAAASRTAAAAARGHRRGSPSAGAAAVPGHLVQGLGGHRRGGRPRHRPGRESEFQMNFKFGLCPPLTVRVSCYCNRHTRLSLLGLWVHFIQRSC